MAANEFVEGRDQFGVRDRVGRKLRPEIAAVAGTFLSLRVWPSLPLGAASGSGLNSLLLPADKRRRK